MKKLSQKERNQTVTKGFLEDQNFVTKDYLKEYIDSKDFVTKEWSLEMFESFEKRMMEELKNHTNSLMDFARHENKLIVEALLYRIERIERHVNLPVA